MRLHSRGAPHRLRETFLGRVTSRPCLDGQDRRDYIARIDSYSAGEFGSDWADYAGVFSPALLAETQRPDRPGVYGAPNLDHLKDGDVILLAPSGTVNVLYRKESRHNTILATERCNSLCLMCSQPPKPDDDSYRVKEILRLLELIDQDCVELGISGGEPTLLGDRFLEIISKAKECLPNTALHVLSNGRLFKRSRFARQLGEIEHPDLMLGIPLYSDIDYEHDYVVQARGAFEETVLGLYNLARSSVAIEIRVVLHALTHQRLPKLAEFIYRNFPFARHVALMGLEMFGYTNLNYEKVWIDPYDYRSQLEEATLLLSERGMIVSIYNHQLCTLPRSLWPFARQSISDWKNIYLEECDGCAVQSFCAGFFHSASKRHSAHINAIAAVSDETIQALRFYLRGETPSVEQEVVTA